jgi:hypothetical protein
MSTSLFFENEFLSLEDIAEGYILLRWKKNTERMRIEEYKTCVQKYAEAIAQLKSPLFLVDTREFLFTIPPKIQEWINEEIFPKNIEDGLRRMAILTSSDFLSQLSVEQTMHENPSLGFASHFFDSEEKALSWLLEEA